MDDDQEETLIVGEVIPLMEMPVVRYVTDQPDPARLLWALVQGRSNQNVGTIEPSGEPECPWCTRPVVDWGDTCNLGCYELWVMWQKQLAIPGNEQYRVVQPEDVVPVSAEFQPWYRRMM